MRKLFENVLGYAVVGLAANCTTGVRGENTGCPRCARAIRATRRYVLTMRGRIDAPAKPGANWIPACAGMTSEGQAVGLCAHMMIAVMVCVGMMFAGGCVVESGEWAEWYSPFEDEATVLDDLSSEALEAAEKDILMINCSSLTDEEFIARLDAQSEAGCMALGRSAFTARKRSLDDLKAFAARLGANRVLYRIVYDHSESGTTVVYRPMPTRERSYIQVVEDGKTRLVTVDRDRWDWVPTTEQYHVQYLDHVAVFFECREQDR